MSEAKDLARQVRDWLENRQRVERAAAVLLPALQEFMAACSAQDSGASSSNPAKRTAKRWLTAAEQDEICSRTAAGETIVDVAESMGIARSTAHRYSYRSASKKRGKK